MNRYNALITAVANSHNGTLARALQVLIQMKSHRNRLKLSSDGRLSGSSEAVLSLEPDIVTINSLLTVCEKNGAWEMALGLLEDLKEGSARDPSMRGKHMGGSRRRSKYPGVPGGPDLISYNAAIAACRKDGQWECAMNLLDDMRSAATVEPDLISFNSALGVCVKARNPGAGRAALEIWRRIAAAGSDGAPPGSTNRLHRRKTFRKKGTSLEPDDITFDTMVDALENDSTEGCYEFADHFFSLGIRRGQYKDVYTGVDYGRYLEKEVAKSEEEEVGTPEGTLTASTSAAQLQELKGTKCHVLDLHGCSQVRAQVAVRHVLKRFARGLVTPEEKTHSEAPDSPATIAALELDQLTLPLSSHDFGNDDKHMDKNQDEDDAVELKYDLVVITGKGLHSEDAPVLVSETRAYLSDPDKFDPPLEIREVKGNSGRFVIPMSSIKAWALAVPRKPD